MTSSAACTHLPCRSLKARLRVALAGMLALAGPMAVCDASAGAGEAPQRLTERQFAGLKLAAKENLDDLFADDGPKAKAEEPKAFEGIGGYLQFELARTIADPEHWSKARGRFELGGHGQLSRSVKWKATGRFDYDAAYRIEDNFYPSAVRHDQRQEFSWRETYLDISAGNWEYRLGRQNIVWGEMVGLFFADVVSAKDLREFILPEFDALRIPQWAARAEYFADDVHAEAIWIPYPSYDNVGKPCSEFFAFPAPPVGVPDITPCSNGSLHPLLVFNNPERPKRSLSNSNYGLRASVLTNGWDLSAFAYRSYDGTPSYYRAFNGPVTIFTPRYERITQSGGTLAKDFGSFVLKAEAIVTTGRKYTVRRIADPDGVVRQDTLDYVVGLDFTLPKDIKLNLQVFQRIFKDHDPDIVPERQETGFTALLSGSPWHDVEAQILLIRSLNRPDWLVRPRLTWTFERNWRWAVGADIFGGPQLGFFGQYANRDRVYTELRYSF